MYMIYFVLDDPDLLDELLDAWNEAGIQGVTINESTGYYRRQNIKVPMRYVFPSAGREERGHYTLTAIVETRELVDLALKAAENLVGNLDQPNTGVLAAWPLEVVRGVPGIRPPVKDE